MDTTTPIVAQGAYSLLLARTKRFVAAWDALAARRTEPASFAKNAQYEHLLIQIDELRTLLSMLED